MIVSKHCSGVLKNIIIAVKAEAGKIEHITSKNSMEEELPKDDKIKRMWMDKGISWLLNCVVIRVSAPWIASFLCLFPFSP